MIKLKRLIESSNKLDYILSEYRKETNYTDFYMSGGCYTFADALYRFVGGNAKIWAVGEKNGIMAHTGIYYGGKYCDYNGCRNKKDILMDIALFGNPKWFYINQKDLQSEHNYDKKDVKEIVKELESMGGI